MGNPQKTLTLHHANGVKSEYIEFKLVQSPGKQEADTVLWGVVIKWDSLGRISTRQEYREGKLEGDSEDWFPGGSRRVLLTYRNGKLVSGTYWHENGNISNQVRPGPVGDTFHIYDELGKLQSVQVVETVP